MQFPETGNIRDREEIDELSGEIVTLKQQHKEDTRKIAELQARIDTFEEERLFLIAQNESHVDVWKANSEKWSRSYLDAQNENVELRDVIRNLRTQLKVHQKEKELMEAKVERLDKKSAKQKSTQDCFRSTVDEYVGKVKPNSWAYNKLVICNVTPTGAANPKREVIAILSRLAMNLQDNDFEVPSCTELINEPGVHQILVEFKKVQDRLEFMTKFPKLSNHQFRAVSQLTLVDPIGVSTLFKKAVRKLKGKNGVAECKLLHSQLVVKIKKHSPYLVLETEEQINALADQLATSKQSMDICPNSEKDTQVETTTSPRAIVAGNPTTTTTSTIEPATQIHEPMMTDDERPTTSARAAADRAQQAVFELGDRRIPPTARMSTSGRRYNPAQSNHQRKSKNPLRTPLYTTATTTTTTKTTTTTTTTTTTRATQE